ncbi:DUF2125 domain-containing protein [Salibaculum sp.]|uniref:DUF2125 domain-containing protein n=1 Tax=Salibaculum sp. TaxID=2855480 RepID=UPI002B4A68A3|nr:DUF2125 domain-containing protein [Salibaculum sp.]HKL69927.1 DUF2125 domain-containing protein [Salibaculum sp.]
MTKPFVLRMGGLGAALLCGSAASADVTAQQVWDNWKTQIDAYGEGVSIGSETMSGDTLTVDSLTMEISDEEMNVEAEMGPLTFTELGDGTVRVGMPESYPMTLEVDGNPVQVTISNEGLEIIASGTPGALAYDLSADRYAITLDSLGPEFEEEGILNAGMIAMNDVRGDYTVATGDDLTVMDYTLDVGSAEIDVDLRERGGPGVILVAAQMANLGLNAEIAMPEAMDTDAPETMFAEGFAFEGGYSIGTSTYEFEIDEEGESMSGNVATDSTGLTVAAGYDGMTYRSQTQGLDINVSVPNELPFPVEAALSTFGFTLDVPLSQSLEPQDFELGMELRDLTVGNGLWNIFDPGEALPRDPATLALNLTGQATPLFDFMDPEQARQAAMSDMPAELHEVDLNELILRVAGAEVTGDGGFTFDNSDLQTIPGIPRPEGQADFRLVGVNGLIDNLIQMGLIPQQQAAAPRMMLGMFATPVGDDELTSTIEINEQGHILANGQRIR